MLIAQTEVIHMRIPHPLWRGFWLAVVMTAGLVLLGFADTLAAFRLDRRMIAFSGAFVVGAFIAALPRRLRRRTSPAPSAVSPRRRGLRCLGCFLCGAGMALGLGLAGGGALLPCLLTGSAGAVAFAFSALLTGFITLRIAERRRP